MWFNCKWSAATLINLFSSVINDNSAGKLSEVAIKSSSTKSYLSILSFFVYGKAYSSFPCWKNLELILKLLKLKLSIRVTFTTDGRRQIQLEDFSK